MLLPLRYGLLPIPDAGGVSKAVDRVNSGATLIEIEARYAIDSNVLNPVGACAPLFLTRDLTPTP